MLTKIIVVEVDIHLASYLKKKNISLTQLDKNISAMQNNGGSGGTSKKKKNKSKKAVKAQ